MKTRFLIVLVMGCLVLAGCVGVRKTGELAFTLQFQDSLARPVVDAQVQIFRGEEQILRRTDLKGKISVTLPKGTYRVVADDEVFRLDAQVVFYEPEIPLVMDQLKSPGVVGVVRRRIDGNRVFLLSGDPTILTARLLLQEGSWPETKGFFPVPALSHTEENPDRSYWIWVPFIAEAEEVLLHQPPDILAVESFDEEGKSLYKVGEFPEDDHLPLSEAHRALYGPNALRSVGDFCSMGTDEPDGRVDVWDLIFLLQRYGKEDADSLRADIGRMGSNVVIPPNAPFSTNVGEPGYGPDGRVDVWDLILLLKAYGATIERINTPLRPVLTNQNVQANQVSLEWQMREGDCHEHFVIFASDASDLVPRIDHPDRVETLPKTATQRTINTQKHFVYLFAYNPDGSGSKYFSPPTIVSRYGNPTIALHTPENEDVVAIPVEFTWAATPGTLQPVSSRAGPVIESYRFFIAPVGANYPAPTPLFQPHTTRGDLIPGQDYKWKVEAIQSDGKTVQSEERTFTTRASAPVVDGSTINLYLATTNATMTWAPVNGVDGYRIYSDGALLGEVTAAGPFVWVNDTYNPEQEYVYEIVTFTGDEDSPNRVTKRSEDGWALVTGELVDQYNNPLARIDAISHSGRPYVVSFTSETNEFFFYIPRNEKMYFWGAGYETLELPLEQNALGFTKPKDLGLVVMWVSGVADRVKGEVVTLEIIENDKLLAQLTTQPDTFDQITQLGIQKPAISHEALGLDNPNVLVLEFFMENQPLKPVAVSLYLPDRPLEIPGRQGVVTEITIREAFEAFNRDPDVNVSYELKRWHTGGQRWISIGAKNPDEEFRWDAWIDGTTILALIPEIDLNLELAEQRILFDPDPSGARDGDMIYGSIRIDSMMDLSHNRVQRQFGGLFLANYEMQVQNLTLEKLEETQTALQKAYVAQDQVRVAFDPQRWRDVMAETVADRAEKSRTGLTFRIVPSEDKLREEPDKKEIRNDSQLRRFFQEEDLRNLPIIARSDLQPGTKYQVTFIVQTATPFGITRNTFSLGFLDGPEPQTATPPLPSEITDAELIPNPNDKSFDLWFAIDRKEEVQALQNYRLAIVEEGNQAMIEDLFQTGGMYVFPWDSTEQTIRNARYISRQRDQAGNWMTYPLEADKAYDLVLFTVNEDRLYERFVYSVRTGFFPPRAPQFLRSEVFGTSIILHWTLLEEEYWPTFSHFELRWATETHNRSIELIDTGYASEVIAVPGITRYRVLPLVPDTLYHFQLIVHDRNDLWDASEIRTLRTRQQALLRTPQITEVRARRTDQQGIYDVTVFWKDDSEDGEGYRLAISDDDTQVATATVGRNAFRHTFSNLPLLTFTDYTASVEVFYRDQAHKAERVFQITDAPPPIPMIQQVWTDDDSIFVEWAAGNPSVATDFFRLEYGLKNQEVWLVEVVTQDTEGSISQFLPDQWYNIRVVAVNANGETTSAGTEVLAPVRKPAIPKNLQARLEEDEWENPRVILTWDAVGGVSQYRIWRSDWGNNFDRAQANRYRDRDLRNEDWEKTFTYEVQSISRVGNREVLSDPASVTIYLASPVRPIDAVVLEAQLNDTQGEVRIDLGWTESPQAVRYLLSRSVDGATPTYRSIPAPNLTFSDYLGLVTQAATYTYMVQVLGNATESAWSNEVIIPVKPIAPEDRPRLVFPDEPIEAQARQPFVLPVHGHRLEQVAAFQIELIFDPVVVMLEPNVDLPEDLVILPRKMQDAGWEAVIRQRAPGRLLIGLLSVGQGLSFDEGEVVFSLRMRGREQGQSLVLLGSQTHALRADHQTVPNLDISSIGIVVVEPAPTPQLLLESHEVRAGEAFGLPVFARRLDDVAAFQIELIFDPAGLRPDPSVENPDDLVRLPEVMIAQGWEVSVRSIGNDRLMIALMNLGDGKRFEEKTHLFSVKMVSTGSTGSFLSQFGSDCVVLHANSTPVVDLDTRSRGWIRVIPSLAPQFIIQDTAFGANQEGRVPVWGRNLPKLVGMQFEIRFDPEWIQLPEVESLTDLVQVSEAVLKAGFSVDVRKRGNDGVMVALLSMGSGTAFDDVELFTLRVEGAGPSGQTVMRLVEGTDALTADYSSLEGLDFSREAIITLYSERGRERSDDDD